MTTEPTPTATDLARNVIAEALIAAYHPDVLATITGNRDLVQFRATYHKTANIALAALAAQGLTIAGPGQTTDTITISRKEETVKNPDANLTDDEQVLFDVRDAIAGAHKDDGTVVGAYAAIDAIRRMHNMGLVARRKHEQREPEPDLSSLDAALSATDDQPAARPTEDEDE